MKRRTFLQTSLAAGAGVVLGAEVLGAAFPQGSAEFTLPELPFPAAALEPYIDAQTMTIHHDKHHAGYVANLNKALAAAPDWQGKPVELLLASLNDLPKDVRTAVRNNGGGHYNHSQFWQWLTPKAGQAMPEPLQQALVRDFGSVDQFRSKFVDAAKTVFGSGWAWLVRAPGGQLVVVQTPNQDNPLLPDAPVKGKPLLGLDVWEHAYYLKYQNRRAEYIDAFWNVVNWEKVSQQLLER